MTMRRKQESAPAAAGFPPGLASGPTRGGVDRGRLLITPALREVGFGIRELGGGEPGTGLAAGCLPYPLNPSSQLPFATDQVAEKAVIPSSHP